MHPNPRNWPCILGLIGVVLVMRVSAEPMLLSGGLETSGSTDSWSAGDGSFLAGPYLDAEIRAPLGAAGYWSSWYEGHLRYSTGSEAILDTSTLGLRYGGNLGDDSYLLRGSVDFSSTLGDEIATVDSDWSAEYTRAFRDQWNGTLRYSGLSRYQDGATDDRISHGADVEIAWDPSLAVGVRTGPLAAVTTYADQVVLRPDGTETAVRRRDVAAEYRFGLEGLLGFFTIWSVDLIAGVVESNANQLLEGKMEQTEDRASGSIAATLSTRPSRAISCSASVLADAAWYTERTALDGEGAATNATVQEVWVTGTLDGSWFVTERWTLLAGFEAGRLVSNDQTRDGWTATALLAAGAKLR